MKYYKFEELSEKSRKTAVRKDKLFSSGNGFKKNNAKQMNELIYKENGTPIGFVEDYK